MNDELRNALWVRIAPLLLSLSLLLLTTACATQSTPTPPLRVSTSAPTATATTPPPPPTATPTPGSGPGQVSGDSCYPSAYNPALTLTFEPLDGGQIISRTLPAGQPDFAVDLPPGNYVAYAETVGTGLRGSYSQAVPCGLTVDCPDHSLLPFTVPPGGAVSDINLCDWNRRPGVYSLPPDAAPKSVLVTTLQKMHLYPRPALAAEPLRTLSAAVTAPAVARTAAGRWLKIQPPQGEAGWLYAPLTRIQGEPGGLPLAADSQGNKLPPEDQFSPSPRRTFLPNGGLGNFRGYLRNEAGQPVEGFSLLLTNGTWSVLTHPSGPSHHYPDYDPGEWDLMLVNPAEAAGWWAITVVSYDCPDFDGGFNAQCKQFTPLSETAVVRTIFPDATILEQDWICHYDCDQGLVSQMSGK